jgi:excisionase family DNA binding protein
MGARVWSPAMSSVTHHMTIARAENLPPVVDVVTAAAILGIGRTAVYELIRTGTWPTPALRLGKLIRIPTGPLLELIQLPRTGT